MGNSWLMEQSEHTTPRKFAILYRVSVWSPKTTILNITDHGYQN